MSETKQRDNGRSSMYEKITPDLRRKVDIALLERVPATYIEVYMTFKLHEHAVTYMSFYRYARRLRDRANVAELANLDEETDTNLNPALNKLAARQLLEILLNEHDFEPRVLNFLTAILHRLNTADHQERTLTHHSAYSQEKLNLARAKLNLKSQYLDLLRERFRLIQPIPENKSLPAHTNACLLHPASSSIDSKTRRADLLEAIHNGKSHNGTDMNYESIPARD